ncbi:MAG: DUF4450 domain-containing protein [Bacteroidales bacterium]|nr:DUF4450 domain-containing protein [Bacteroidales bacterium]
MKPVKGIYPPQSKVKISDASEQSSPVGFFNSVAGEHPAITGLLPVQLKSCYFALYLPGTIGKFNYKKLEEAFLKAEDARKKLAERIVVNTPDEYINTLGGALAIAADAVYQEPSYLHGAIAWRMWLNGWRGASCADALGWHDRAKTHFSGYIQSQVTEPATGPVVPDTLRHFARQKEEMGTSMFSSGYICRNPKGDFRPHHYDMNLVFIDQLLTHYLNTGDVDYIRETWPAIKLHLAWEKRNYDGDNDGLFDAYCCIWASDAIQYNGGKVAYSSAYNYRANLMAAQIAEILGEDPKPYHDEALKILKAVNRELWLSDKGRYAENKDIFGLEQTHDMPGIWTIYHTLDEGVADPFQAYQCTRYIDEEIPHIPVIANGIEGNYYTISTTSWMPYTWSVNNVALAEVLHASLAYWQAGRSDDAFLLWKSALIESMYLGASPGNFQQLSFYDAMRGELYRDFADPIGMASRTLVEGLFGVKPDALDDTLTIRPGFPQKWEFAELKTPDIQINYERQTNNEIYEIRQSFPQLMNLRLQINAQKDKIKKVLVNGQQVKWHSLASSVGQPKIEINLAKNDNYTIEISWEGQPTNESSDVLVTANGTEFSHAYINEEIIDFYDPQKVFSTHSIEGKKLKGKINTTCTYHTFFVKLRQGDILWWKPFNMKVEEPLQIKAEKKIGSDVVALKVKNNVNERVTGEFWINSKVIKGTTVEVGGMNESIEIEIPLKEFVPGSNSIIFSGEGLSSSILYTDWELPVTLDNKYETIDLSGYFNEKVNRIFKIKYLSPRSEFPTLQTPWQGIGNWCYPWIMADINDSGLRKLAGDGNIIEMPQGIPFSTPSDTNKPNIAFVTQWDNYPSEIIIPLNGRSSHAYLMMTGTTSPMQSRFKNGEVVFTYTDGSQDILELKNPETWWPIEQDYYTDGYAFSIDYPKPYRLHLKTGLITREFNDYSKIKGFSNYAIDGGAATILDFPLNSNIYLKSITIKADANEVLIGLMSLTLVR